MYEFDWIAQNIYLPIYPVIAGDILDRTGKTSGRLLDLGCGGGHLGLSILQQAAGMTAVLLDKNPEAVLLAHRRAGEWGLGPRAVAIVGDVGQLPLPEGSVDLAVSRGSVHFWENIDAAFAEILRVLAPGGAAYIGSGMGNRELGDTISEKMKEINPDWPDCVHRRSTGHTVEDYASLVEQKGASCEILQGGGQGSWVVFRKPAA